MSLRASVERKRKEHAKETARRQKQWQEMKRKAEEDTARAALDALERRKSERARLANYMREGWAAPKQIHIGREVLIRELGEGDENALPWPEKTPGGGSNECRDSVPAGVEDRKRVLQAAQHNGRGVWLGRCNRKGREESGDTVPVAQAGRNRGGFDAEGHKRGGETKGPESEGPHVIRGGQEVELRSAADRGSAQGRVRSDRAPRECDKAHRQEGSLGRMVSEGASVSEGRTSEGNGGNEYEVVGGTTREKKEWPGKIGTGGTEEVVERHRRPRWNTRVIQEYGTAKLLKARGWERSKAVRLRVGDGADLMVKDEGRKGNDCEVEGKGKDGNRGQASGGGVREGPTLAARESPWVIHEESRENADPAERPAASTSHPHLPQGVPSPEPATRAGPHRRKWSPQETRALASEGSVLMTHSPPGTAGPGGRAAAISDVSNRGDAESGDVSSREEVHGRVTSGAGSSGDDRSRADGSADKVVATTVGDVSGKKSATHSGPRGGLRASMQVLQRELAHMHASSNWATSRLVLGSAGSPETVGSDRQTSAREDNSGVGWMDAARVRLDSEGNVPADHFLGGRDGFGPNQNQSQGGVARTGDLGRGASSSNDELVTDRKCDPGISGRSPCFEAEKIPVGAPERQSLADFLALEVQADRMAGREAFLKQRALSAANERRRLTEARKRPGSGDSIPECVEVAEEGSGGEEGRGPERRLSVFTPPEKEGQRNGAEKQTLEPVRRGEVTERGAANDNGEGMEWRNRAESAAPGICDTGNAEGKSGTNKRGDSGLAESGREKGGEKGDLTARLAAEVAALKARLAAKDAEIMRIRRAERPSEAAVSTSGRNAKTSMPEHNPIIKRIPIAGDAEAEAERKSQTEAEAEAEVELAAKSEAATRSEGRGGETGFPEAESAPSGRNGVRERKKEAEYKAEKRAVVRGGSLAWEFVPPERGSAVDLPVAVRNDSGHVMDLQAESEAFSTVQSDPFYPRARTDESRLQTPAATRGRVENRAAGGEPKRGVLTTDWNLTEVTCAPNREVSQDSLCPPRGAPAEISDVSGPHVARPGAMQGFSTRHVPRPNSVRDGSLDVPRPVLSNARHRDILGFPGAEPRPEAFSQPEPSVSNRVSFAVERETRPESFLQGPRVPYALPGESGISAVRVWEAFQMSRHQTPSGRRHSDVTPSLATAYGQRPAYEPIAPQRRHSGNPVMTSAAATGGVHRPPTALSLEEQSILASLQRLDLKLRGMAESSQGATRVPVRPPNSVASAPVPAPERLHTGQSKLETRSTGANAFGRSAELPAERPPPKVAWQKAKRSRTGVTNGRNEQPPIRGAHRAQFISQPYAAKQVPDGGLPSNKGVISQSPAAAALLS